MSDPAPCAAHEESPGVVSSMRVVFLGAAALGGITILAGLVGWFMRIPDASLIIGAGTGLITLAAGAKAWQAQAENRGPSGP